MKALLCTAHGGPELLQLEEIAAPRPAPGEVVVAMRAAALNFFDTLIIAGKYQFKPELPFSPGAELAGIVEEVGDGVEEFAPGQRVMAFVGWGACREKIAVPAEKLIPIPAGIDDETAAGMIVTYGTTLYALKNRANLQAGETLAVLGASGGVGIAAVEIGKAMGARVIACASSEEKLAFCASRGADETLNYSNTPLREGLKQLTGGTGVDVIYDPVGGDYAESALRAIAWNGRFLVIGFAAGEIPKIPLNLALLKNCAIVGVFWGAFVERENDTHRANMAQILSWIGEGKLSPHVDRTYPLADTAQALSDIATRQARGKIVITP